MQENALEVPQWYCWVLCERPKPLAGDGSDDENHDDDPMSIPCVYGVCGPQMCGGSPGVYPDSALFVVHPGSVALLHVDFTKWRCEAAAKADPLVFPEVRGATQRGRRAVCVRGGARGLSAHAVWHGRWTTW